MLVCSEGFSMSGCVPAKTYPPKRIFECCQSSNCTQIEVKQGQIGTLCIYEAPPGFCFCVDRLVWDRCCKNSHYYPVSNPNCPEGEDYALEMASGESVDLAAGTYRISIFDQDCNAVAPDTGEVVAELTQNPC